MAAAASAADGIKDAPLKDTTSGRTISLGDRIGVRLTTHQVLMHYCIASRKSDQVSKRAGINLNQLYVVQMVEGCIFELHEQEKWMILTQEGANSPLTRTFR